MPSRRSSRRPAPRGYADARQSRVNWLVFAAMLAGVVAVAAALMPIGGDDDTTDETTTQDAVELAGRNRSRPCPSTSAAAARADRETLRRCGRGRGGHQHGTPTSSPTGSATPSESATTDPGTDPSATADPSATTQPSETSGGGTPSSTAPPPLNVLATDCSNSQLQPHTGFQDGNRCVSTAFGEVADAADNPSLLIKDAPENVDVGQPFDITVSTRNLVRDRFLAAAAGGYYAESSLLNEDGLVRGHFHTACRQLDGSGNAPDPAPVPAFFKATEDGGGSANADDVTVTIPGLAQSGLFQCAVWAGDGSHRVPMMQRANQVPAFDVIRVQVG